MSKTCFVICPIGSEGSLERIHSDKVFNYIISPTVKEYGYIAERADHISEPGKITTQIIDRIINSDLVVADLSGHNPNVFYELAVRHAVKKPLIQIIKNGENIPFDIADMRTIFYGLDIDMANRTTEEIKKQLNAIDSGNSAMNSPITSAIIFMNAMNSISDEDSQKTILDEIYKKLTKIELSFFEMNNTNLEKKRINIDSSQSLSNENKIWILGREMDLLRTELEDIHYTIMDSKPGRHKEALEDKEKRIMERYRIKVEELEKLKNG